MDVTNNVVHMCPTNHEYYTTSVHLQSLTNHEYYITSVHLQSLTESKRENNPCSSLLQALRVPGA